jgi:hypothetical protein
MCGKSCQVSSRREVIEEGKESGSGQLWAGFIATLPLRCIGAHAPRLVP